MPRNRRYIESNTPYELCFRAKDSLPFSVHNTITLIIKSSIARAQRDEKVIICHDVWEGSHPHMLLVAKDAEKFRNFYTEVEKKITDSVKALLGLDHLEIWEERPTLIQIDDLETAKEKIAYLYANPAQDNIATSIEKFRGYSSWREYKQCKRSLHASKEESVSWLRLPSFPTLTDRVLDPIRDARLVMLLKRRNAKKHTLKREPNRWMECFGVSSDEEVRKINEGIFKLIEKKEKAAAEQREAEGKRVLPLSVQFSQEILKPHTPKKKGRGKPSYQTSCPKRRREIKKKLRDIDEQCRKCYERARLGDYSVEWPPGTFRPPAPPLANALPGG